MIPRHSADGCAGVWVSVGVAVVGGVAVAVVVGAGVGAAVTAGVGVWVGLESYFRQTLLYADLLPCVLAVAVLVGPALPFASVVLRDARDGDHQDGRGRCPAKTVANKKVTGLSGHTIEFGTGLGIPIREFICRGKMHQQKC